MENKQAWYLSSTGKGLALRIKSLVPIVVAIAGAFNLSLDSEGLNGLADTLEVAAVAALALVGAVYQVVGWLRMKRYKVEKLGKYA